MPTAALPRELFEPVAGWDCEVFDPAGIVDDTKFAQCRWLNVGRQPSTAGAVLHQGRFAIAEARDHRRKV
jgi:hypothetical protein